MRKAKRLPVSEKTGNSPSGVHSHAMFQDTQMSYLSMNGSTATFTGASDKNGKNIRGNLEPQARTSKDSLFHSGREDDFPWCCSLGAESHIPAEEITPNDLKGVSAIHHRSLSYHTNSCSAVYNWNFTSLLNGGTRSCLRSSSKTKKERILPRRRIYPKRFRSQRPLSQTTSC
ncbi:hypothetical protein AVEN_113969-1 [Araneus ventricosus]|uniref:Uncharacterized protein n=1 Tax=Araneus ventricosus TaxID=182803 RepID=A0A4Y2MS42_ARAVE|nr:hypothetical protein AVEN_113969-1 [Araneus ventricosus]